MVDGNLGNGFLMLVIFLVFNLLVVLVVGWLLNVNISQQNFVLQQQKVIIDQLKMSVEMVGLNIKNQIDKVKVIEDFFNDLMGFNEMC